MEKKPTIILDSEQRQPKVVAIVGTTGTGKSTLAIKIAKKINPAPGKEKRVLVLTYSGSPEIWKDIKVIEATKEGLSFTAGWRHIHVWKDEKNTIFNIFKYYHDGAIIFDDCKNYLPSNWENIKGLKQLVIDHRHGSLDILIIAHALDQVPKKMWAAVKWLWIGKTTAHVKESDIVSSNKELIFETQNAVNEEIRKMEEQGGDYKGKFKCVRI